jgi:hypothetical protein
MNPPKVPQDKNIIRSSTALCKTLPQSKLSQRNLPTIEASARELNMIENILLYIQQDVTLHSLFYMETALHVSGGTTTHHQERKQLYLEHLLFMTPLLLPTAISGR